MVLGSPMDHLLDTVLLNTHSTCLFTAEERLKGIDILLFECKYCDCFLIL